MRKITIYIDGASRGNPGPSGLGVVFCNEKGQPFKKYPNYLGDNFTNNEAEYRAAIFALEKFKALFGKKLVKNTDIQIKSDSELLIKQLKGEYKILDPKIQALFLKVWNLKIDFKKIKFTLIPREKNKTADELANRAIDEKEANQKLI